MSLLLFHESVCVLLEKRQVEKKEISPTHWLLHSPDVPKSQLESDTKNREQNPGAPVWLQRSVTSASQGLQQQEEVVGKGGRERE